MRIDSSSPDFETTLCFLNGKWCKYAVAADDEAGWVDVPDVAAMKPFESIDIVNGPSSEEECEWEEVKLKRLYGKVEFKKAVCKR